MQKMIHVEEDNFKELDKYLSEGATVKNMSAYGRITHRDYGTYGMYVLLEIPDKIISSDTDNFKRAIPKEVQLLVDFPKSFFDNGIPVEQQSVCSLEKITELMEPRLKAIMAEKGMDVENMRYGTTSLLNDIQYYKMHHDENQNLEFI